MGELEGVGQAGGGASSGQPTADDGSQTLAGRFSNTQTALPWESGLQRALGLTWPHFHVRSCGGMEPEIPSLTVSPYTFQGDPGEDGKPVSLLFSQSQMFSVTFV